MLDCLSEIWYVMSLSQTYSAGIEAIKHFSCSTQLSKKFTLLMPTIVGLLTFIIRINTSSDSLKARKISVFRHFSFYEQLKLYAAMN